MCSTKLSFLQKKKNRKEDVFKDSEKPVHIEKKRAWTREPAYLLQEDQGGEMEFLSKVNRDVSLAWLNEEWEREEKKRKRKKKKETRRWVCLNLNCFFSVEMCESDRLSDLPCCTLHIVSSFIHLLSFFFLCFSVFPSSVSSKQVDP